MTPEQMRVLADRGDEYALPTQYLPKDTPNYMLVRDLTAALRAAADQIDACDTFAALRDNGGIR